MDKLFGYGRTRTRLSLILLSALAVLCIVIVSLCVFYNFNALATYNIAYAEEEEPVRNIISTGECEPNMLPNNYALDWSYSVSGSAGTSFTLCEDDAFRLVVYSANSYTISNNYFTGTDLCFRVYVVDYTKWLSNVNYSSLILYKSSGSSCSWTTGNIFSDFYSSGNWQNSNSISNSNTNVFLRGQVNFVPSQNGYFQQIRFVGSGTLRIRAVGLFSANSNVPYVPKSYSNYGYDQGYQDGLIAGGGSGSTGDYSDISSSGVVRDNLMNNNDATVWDFDTTVSTDYSNRTLFYGGNFDISFNATDAFIFNNGISAPGTSATSLFFEPTDSFSFESSKYTFTLGFLEYHSVYNTTIQVNVNGTTITNDSFTLEEAYNGFIFSTFDLSSYGGSGTAITSFVIHVTFNQLDTEQYPIDASLVRIRFIKLEQGDSFSGYVPRAYTMYGFNEASSVAYQEGYQAGLENGQLESFNYIGDLENMPIMSDYFDLPGTTYRRLVSYAAEEDSYRFNDIRYSYQYFNTQGDDSGSVYNGLVFDYLFRYKVRIVTQFYGSASRWSQVGFKFLIIQSDNRSNYFFVSREDTNYITFLSTWTGTDFGDVYNVQIDIPLPDNTKTYYVAIVPITWNYHNVNADSRDLRADASWQDTSTFLIWDNTKFYGLTNQSNYQDIVNDRVNEAWSDGHYQGIQEGRAQGEQTGYTIGYNEGVSASNNYTFMSLIGAVFDAPIGALRGLLNFNILGVNLYDFIIALLSLAIVLFVFRVFVRGL